MLPDYYLNDAEKRARKFIGQWHGSSGGLAADVIRLLKERESILQELKKTSGNSCCETTQSCCNPSEVQDDFILRGEQQLNGKSQVRFTGDSVLNESHVREGSQSFINVLEELKQMHLRKTKDYGSQEDALKNIKDGADVVNLESWKACLIRMADKMTRLRNFCHNGKCEFDGVEDTLLDLAAYSAICLVLFRETTGNSKKLH